MHIKTERDGDRLKLSADNAARSEIAQLLRESYERAESFISDALHESWEFIRPEEIGALTSSPILAECDSMQRDDSGELITADLVAWFPSYAIRCPWRELANTGRVLFVINMSETKYNAEQQAKPQ